MRLRELFYLHKSDRQVLLVLLTLAAIALCILHFVGREETEQSGGEELLATEEPQSARQPMDSTRAQQITYAVPSTVSCERFPFDPNTADSTQLLRLGLRPWQVRNIYKYRAHGGIYRKKEDFARLYGLTVKEYRSLEPYIRISPDYLPASTLVGNASKRYDNIVGNAIPADTPTRGLSQRYSSYPVKLHPGETIDLNTTDTTDLKTVPGIGSYYARRIAEYGHRLGGYVSIDQLDEIENFPLDAKPFFVIAITGKQQRLKINQLSLNDLRQHPYINYYQARAITDYRRLYGPIHQLEDLRLLSEFTPADLQRLQPYVTFEE